MPADFFINLKQEIVYSKAIGNFNRSLVLEHMTQLLQHAEFRPEFNQLLDLREVTSLELCAEDVKDLASRNIFSTKSRRAIVVVSDGLFGFVRMFGTYREIEGEQGIRIFRRMNEALSWLGLTAEPDPNFFPKLALPADKS